MRLGESNIYVNLQWRHVRCKQIMWLAEHVLRFICKQTPSALDLGRPKMESSAYARLKGRLGGSNFEFYMTKKRVVIGRKSKLGDVDVNMGYSRFISRRHLEIALDRDSFYFLCRGKNGIYLDDNFQKRENKRMELPTRLVWCGVTQCTSLLSHAALQAFSMHWLQC